MTKNKGKRVGLMLVGIVLIGLAVSFMRLADLGADAFTTLNIGFSEYFGVSFGLIQAITNIILLFFIFFANKKYISIGTVVNMFGVGFISDFFAQLIIQYLGEDFSMPQRLLLMGVALVLISAGAGMYMSADLGIAPYDALAPVLVEQTHNKISFRVLRITTDVLCVVLGFLFGSTVGIGTIVMAFLVGPFIGFFKDIISVKFLKQDVPE
ncbi:YczE/YyaS/YitT family protein [Pisciglobus halotolerans]|uniref:Uncharacterized membrane protein YczE n=1 Tax=Pisciglobus halotolerans TaxID=745365 RepID=A0A1I3B5V6_9LACT|nr:hypothetical protein [Pisciglobus halotolerans]SFH57476.1 Uncharacterized membrane protein YczE [Pisciglobus halotolerans]